MQVPIKKSIICKDINLHHCNIDQNKVHYYVPVAGDVAVFKVVSIGKHKQIQSDTKRNVLILPGDHIVAAFGTRYATAQFEGYLPSDCRTEFHILGAGGTIGIISSMHASLADKGPTVLQIVGYVTNHSGQVVNTKKIAGPLNRFTGAPAKRCKIILSVGSSMDSGKTTTAAYLSRGLMLNGQRVSFVKLTGTVYTKDADLVSDCGAQLSIDFSAFGFPSTYLCSEHELLNLFESLMIKATVHEPDTVVIEIADGILQRETKMLLENKAFMSLVDHVVFSCGDSLSALTGVKMLNDLDIYPSALSGLFTASPLLMEEVRNNIGIPVFTIEQLMSTEVSQHFATPSSKSVVNG
ncbi:MAG TPA: hypothetical protein VNR87_13000 [Flavisolibacter sp.]|nr:hypothetical protein [Flavisolibacter sp.]